MLKGLFTVLKFIFRLIEGIGRILMVILLLVLIGMIAGAGGHKAVTAPSDHYALIVHPHGQLVEQLSDTALSLSEVASPNDGPQETLVGDVVKAIRAAKGDAHVKALVIDASDLDHSGLTKIKTIVAAIDEFKTAGKPVYAYARNATQEQYYLLASADQLMLDPTGELELVGIASYQLYFHEALDRLGVDINVFKVGTHKSYPEPFIRQDMSKEDREQRVKLLEPIWSDYQHGIEQSRHLPAGSIDQFIKGSVAGLKSVKGDDAQWALQNKLVTVLGTEQDFEAQMIKEVGEDKTSHSFHALDASDYLELHGDSKSKSHSKNVAVIVAAGDIVDGEAPAGQIGGDTLARILRQARLDDSVKAVVLRVDSGGGSMLASETIRREVLALKAAHKPVVASMSSVAASGGYYIAAEADRIFAEPDTVTGSIGVFAIIPTFQNTLKKFGVASDGFSSSPLAGLDVERSLTSEQKSVLQMGVEHAYSEFVSMVAHARHVPFETLEPLAEGKVYLAPEALHLKLVDQLGTLDDAIADAATRAELKPNEYGIDTREKAPTWREMVIKALKDSRADGHAPSVSAFGLLTNPTQVLSPRFLQLHPQVRSLLSLNDPAHRYVWCACTAP
jgi:protease IV